MASLFDPSYLATLSKTYGLRPSKKYGQNFLIDETVIERIIAAANVDSNGTVVEVGPGFGVLTEALAQQAKEVVSFEIEKKLEQYWQKKNQSLPNVHIEWGNVLMQFPKFNKNCHSYSVVANVPYQITSPLLRLFLEAQYRPTSLVLMVQKEVAERITAQPGDLSLLAISVQYYATAEILFTVPRTSFWPAPAVDSAVIKITPKKEAVNRVEMLAVFRLAQAGFSSKRKLLIKNILPVIGKENKGIALAELEKMGHSGTVRAQELSLSDWQKLVQVLKLV